MQLYTYFLKTKIKRQLNNEFYRVRQIPFFFLENALKKTIKYLIKFLFLFESIEVAVV